MKISANRWFRKHRWKFQFEKEGGYRTLISTNSLCEVVKRLVVATILPFYYLCVWVNWGLAISSRHPEHSSRTKRCSWALYQERWENLNLESETHLYNMKVGKRCRVKGHEINSHWRIPRERNDKRHNIRSGRIRVSPGRIYEATIYTRWALEKVLLNRFGSYY